MSRLNRFFNWALRSWEALLLGTALILLVGFSYWLSLATDDYLKNLGLNLLAGFIGSIVTIFGLDVLMRRMNAHLRVPLRAAVYHDINGLLERAYWFWALGAAASAVHISPNPRTHMDYLSESAINQAIEGEKFSTYWLESESAGGRDSLSRISAEAEWISGQYGGNLNPDIVLALQMLTRDDFASGLYSHGVIFPSFREWSSGVLTLAKWAYQEHRYLERHTLTVSAPFTGGSYRRKR